MDPCLKVLVTTFFVPSFSSMVNYDHNGYVACTAIVLEF